MILDPVRLTIKIIHPGGYQRVGRRGQKEVEKRVFKDWGVGINFTVLLHDRVTIVNNNRAGVSLSVTALT